MMQRTRRKRKARFPYFTKSSQEKAIQVRRDIPFQKVINSFRLDPNGAIAKVIKEAEEEQKSRDEDVNELMKIVLKQSEEKQKLAEAMKENIAKLQEIGTKREMEIIAEKQKRIETEDQKQKLLEEYEKNMHNIFLVFCS